MINILPEPRRRQMQLSWIIHTTIFFIETINGNTEADRSAGTRQAATQFNAGASGASSVYQGYNYARRCINLRRTPGISREKSKKF